MRTYYRRSLLFYWRMNLAVAFGAAVAATALTGALIVGDSMRASLRELALGRLGRIDFALASPRFFREQLCADFSSSARFTKAFSQNSPAILLRGGLTHADRQTRVDHANLIGVDARFWPLDSVARPREVATLSGRSVILNAPLARELGASVGDEVLARTGKPSAIPTETLLGRRDDNTSMLRLAVAAIIPADNLGAFDLSPRQSTALNAYIPLPTLQRALDQTGRVNAILVAARPGAATAASDQTRTLQGLLQQTAKLADLGLKLRRDRTRGYVSLESEAILIEPPFARAAVVAAGRAGADASPVIAYLANTISTQAADASPRTIPYSTIAAIDPAGPLLAAIAPPDDHARSLNPGEILLNDWAASDLRVQPGDLITLTYYVSGQFGRLETRSATFTLRSIVPLDGPAADPTFVPEYHGVTDAERLSDWNPPFPIDLKLIRDKDEDYWKTYRTTPKAFISIEDGKRLWAEQAERFGSLTSLRLTLPGKADLDLRSTNLEFSVPPPERGRPAPTAEEQAAQREADKAPWLDEATAKFERELLALIEPADAGMTFEPVRDRALQAARGSTDFGMLFIGFSFFLIASAAMLVALLFRLGVERRSSEIGLLLAGGFTPQTVAWILVGEGTALAAVGGAAGLLGAGGYAWLMLAGLRSWWSAAVGAPFLRLHGEPFTYVVGFVVGLLVAAASVAWSIRGLTRRSVRSLLAGSFADSTPTPGRRSFSTLMAGSFVAAAAACAVLGLVGAALPIVPAFFLSGTSALAACLALLTRWLHGRPRAAIHRPGPIAVLRLGIRNARRNRGRSLLTAGLIASATFLIVALEAFRLDPTATEVAKDSGTGGFTLYAESAVPLDYDLNTAAGREALNLTGPLAADEPAVHVVPFRLKPGDESSCLNLYQPTQPRILGATDAMIARGGFRFARTLAETDEERANPWLLLRRRLPDGVVPAIGDEAAVLWQLKLGLGKDLVVTDARGLETRLRFVALLEDSVLQSEIIIGEPQFLRLFPTASGYGFFLIETRPERADEVARELEKSLARFSFDAGRTTDRLRGYLAVQNTYLSTFQTLGGFGLLLGTAGLAAVLLRNVWERRRELALMRTVGFSHAALGAMVLIENAVLLIAGLLAGVISAALAIVPAVAGNPASIPWVSLALTLLAVLLTGMIAGLLALIPTLRAPLIPALRAE